MRELMACRHTSNATCNCGIEKRPGGSMMHKDGAKIFDNLKNWE